MKKCCFDGCNLNVWGGGYCLAHQYKRKQAQNKPVKPRSPIRRYKLLTSNKQELKTNKKALVENWGFQNQKQMFDFVWSTREHKCALSGISLDSVSESYRHWTMAHIIPKGLYPMFKLNPDNILLISPEVHQLVDNFTEDMREKHKHINFDLWFSLVEKKKEEYKKFLLDNMF